MSNYEEAHMALLIGGAALFLVAAIAVIILIVDV